MIGKMGKGISEVVFFSLRNRLKTGKDGNGKYKSIQEDNSRKGIRIHSNQNISKMREVKKTEALGDILSRRLQILKEAIDEIDREITERKRLSEFFRKQIDSEVKECQLLLNKLPYPWSQGYQPKTEFIRISLHKSLLTRRKDKRSEELSFWEDLTGLTKEKRKLLMEYEEIKNTIEKLS